MDHPDLLLARQPILGLDQRVFAYELLYRSSVEHSSDGTEETATVAVNALLSIGLDRVVGDKLAFVNIPERMLVERLYEFLPADRVVLEVLETVKATPEVIAEVARARSLGYRIALDDFIVAEDNLGLTRLADFIKVDVLATGPEPLRATIAAAKRSGVVLLAEKVEDHEVASRFTELGFKLFQGHYFARPQPVRGQQLSPSRAVMLRIVAALQDPELELEELEKLIQSDVSLCLKLLRFVNSAAIGAKRPIESIRDALVMVGLERVRMYATMMVLSSLDGKPDELSRTALIRARYCELLGRAIGSKEPRRHFMVGLLSVLDAFVDRSLEDVLAEVPLADDVRVALLDHQGDLGTVLEAAIACEHADWAQMAVVGVDQDELLDDYLEALAFANLTLGAAGL